MDLNPTEIASKELARRISSVNALNGVSLTEKDLKDLLIKGIPRIHKKYGRPSMYSFYQLMFVTLFEIILEDIAENNNIFIIKEKPEIKMWIGRLNRRHTLRKYYKNNKVDISLIGYRYNTFKINHTKKKGKRQYIKYIKIPNELYRKINSRIYFTDEL